MKNMTYVRRSRRRISKWNWRDRKRDRKKWRQISDSQLWMWDIAHGFATTAPPRIRNELRAIPRVPKRDFYAALEKWLK